MQQNVVQRLLKLIRFRNEHPAFDGQFQVQESANHELTLSWKKAGLACCLNVDLNTCQAVIEYLDTTGEKYTYRV